LLRKKKTDESTPIDSEGFIDVDFLTRLLQEIDLSKFTEDASSKEGTSVSNDEKQNVGIEKIKGILNQLAESGAIEIKDGKIKPTQDREIREIFEDMMQDEEFIKQLTLKIKELLWG